jgi:NAD(P)-dependent dehydrogenase (short-subunit alcohol dehydrogenase family)
MSVLDAFSLSGKVSVVTGANRGIGRALATALAEAGSDVVLLVRDTGAAVEAIKELESLGVAAIAVAADVTEPDQVERAAGEVTRSLAAEWAPHGVRVNALAPGYIKTEMAPVDQPEFKRHWIDDAPMRRYAMPSELGPCVVFLAFDAPSFMTGEVVVMDGGYTLF